MIFQGLSFSYSLTNSSSSSVIDLLTLLALRVPKWGPFVSSWVWKGCFHVEVGLWRERGHGHGHPLFMGGRRNEAREKGRKEGGRRPTMLPSPSACPALYHYGLLLRLHVDAIDNGCCICDAIHMQALKSIHAFRC